jgi:hypothetical protein
LQPSIAPAASSAAAVWVSWWVSTPPKTSIWLSCTGAVIVVVPSFRL